MSEQAQDHDTGNNSQPETTGRTSTREVQQASEQSQNEQSGIASGLTARVPYVYTDPVFTNAAYTREPLWMQNQRNGISKGPGARRLRREAAAQREVSAPVQNGPQAPASGPGAVAGQGVHTASAAQGTPSAPVQTTATVPFPALVQSAPATTAVQPLTTQQAAATTPTPIHNTPQAPAPAPGPAAGQGAQSVPAMQSAPVPPAATTLVPTHVPSAPAAAAVQPPPTTQQAASTAPAPQAIAQTQANQLTANHRLTPWAYQPAPPFPPGLHILTPPEALARYPTGIPLQNGTSQLGPNEVLPPNTRPLPPTPRQPPVPIVQNLGSYIGTTQIPQHIVNYVQILRTQSLGLSSTQARTTRQRFDRTGPPAAQHVFNNKWGVLQNHNTKRPGGRLYAELFDYWMDYRLFDHDEWWELITRPGNHGRVWPHAPWQVNVL